MVRSTGIFVIFTLLLKPGLLQSCDKPYLNSYPYDTMMAIDTGKLQKEVIGYPWLGFAARDSDRDCASSTVVFCNEEQGNGFCYDSTLFCFKKGVDISTLSPYFTMHDFAECGSTKLYYAWGLFKDTQFMERPIADIFEVDVKPVKVEDLQNEKTTLNIRVYMIHRLAHISGGEPTPYVMLFFANLVMPTTKIVETPLKGKL